MCVEGTAPFRANAWDSSGGQSCPRRRPKHFAAGRKRQSAPPTGPPSLAVVKRSALVPCDRGRAESPSELCDQPLLEVLKWRSEPTVARRWHCLGAWISRHLGRNVRWPASRLRYAGVTASAVSRCSGLLPRESSGDAVGLPLLLVRLSVVVGLRAHLLALLPGGMVRDDWWLLHVGPYLGMRF